MNTQNPMAHQRPRPQASDLRLVRHASHPIFRASFAAFVAKASTRPGQSPSGVAAELWPGDQIAQNILNRADAIVIDTASQPALVGTSVTDFFAGLPQSAAAKLIDASLKLNLNGRGSLTIPYRSGGAAVRLFVGEGDPIPVVTSTIAETTIGPVKKAAVMLALSGSLARHSAAEAMFRQILSENAAASLDAAIFGAGAATDDNPAGLLNGVTATTGSGATAAEDLAILAGALADAGGSGNVAIICHPKRAATIALTFPNLTWPVWATTAVPSGRVIALDPTAFVSGFGDNVDIDVSNEAAVHMSTVPLEIVSGTGPTVADPVRSAFQTDTIVMRLLIWISFAMRASGRVQFIDNVFW